MDPVVENGIKRFCDKFRFTNKMAILSENLLLSGKLF